MSHTFFTDRDLAKQVPAAMSAAGIAVERHDAHFPTGTPDPVWLREVGRRGWVALTHNKKIRYNTVERDMVMRAGVPPFILIGDTTHAVLARNLLNTFPRIVEFLNSHDPPFIARVYRPSPASGVEAGVPGKVELWLTLDAWKQIVTQRSNP